MDKLRKKLKLYLGDGVKLDEKKGVPGKTIWDKAEYAIANDIQLNKSDFKWLKNRFKDMNNTINGLNNAIMSGNSTDFFADYIILNGTIKLINDGIDNMLSRKKI